MQLHLHRANVKPDWELAARRNIWQRWAARSHGLLTLPNLTSILGAAFVGAGLAYIPQGRLWLGFILMGIGRVLDVLDGFLAEKTGTKSPLGESLDATLDKLAVFAALLVFTGVGILPWPFALLIGLENAATSLVSLVAKSLRQVIHPGRAGKVGTAIEWLALLGFVLGVAVHASFAHIFTYGAFILALISIVMNGYAGVRYAKELRAQQSRERRESPRKR